MECVGAGGTYGLCQTSWTLSVALHQSGCDASGKPVYWQAITQAPTGVYCRPHPIMITS